MRIYGVDINIVGVLSTVYLDVIQLESIILLSKKMKLRNTRKCNSTLLSRIEELIYKINQTEMACISNGQKNILTVIATQKPTGRFNLSEQKDKIYDEVTKLSMPLEKNDRETAHTLNIMLYSNSSN